MMRVDLMLGLSISEGSLRNNVHPRNGRDEYDIHTVAVHDVDAKLKPCGYLGRI